jgi:hypothetical protein
MITRGKRGFGGSVGDELAVLDLALCFRSADGGWNEVSHKCAHRDVGPDEAGLRGGDVDGVRVLPFGRQGDVMLARSLIGVGEALSNGSPDRLVIDIDCRPDRGTEGGVPIDEDAAFPFRNGWHGLERLGVTGTAGATEHPKGGTEKKGESE